jgi:hypothetical protein
VTARDTTKPAAKGITVATVAARDHSPLPLEGNATADDRAETVGHVREGKPMLSAVSERRRELSRVALADLIDGEGRDLMPGMLLAPVAVKADAAAAGWEYLATLTAKRKDGNASESHQKPARAFGG